MHGGTSCCRIAFDSLRIFTSKPLTALDPTHPRTPRPATFISRLDLSPRSLTPRRLGALFLPTKCHSWSISTGLAGHARPSLPPLHARIGALLHPARIAHKHQASTSGDSSDTLKTV